MKRIQAHPGSLIFRHRAASRRVIELLARRPGSRVLSFGCSWGAEIVPLALSLPESDIVAVDIDDIVLEQAERIFADSPNVEVLRSDWTEIGARGPYDAIVANAVLCRYPEATKVDDLTPIFSFSEFSDILGRLLEMLADDGLLMCYNSSYSPRDTEAGQDLQQVFLPPSSSYLPFDNFTSCFDRTGGKIIAHHVAPPALHVDVAERVLDDRAQVIRRLNEGLFAKGRPDLPESDLRPPSLPPEEEDAAAGRRLSIPLGEVYRAPDSTLPGFRRLPVEQRVRSVDRKSYEIAFFWEGDLLMPQAILDLQAC